MDDIQELCNCELREPYLKQFVWYILYTTWPKRSFIKISGTLFLKTVTADFSVTVEPFSLYSISVHVNRDVERLFGIATVLFIFSWFSVFVPYRPAVQNCQLKFWSDAAKVQTAQDQNFFLYPLAGSLCLLVLVVPLRAHSLPYPIFFILVN